MRTGIGAELAIVAARLTCRLRRELSVLGREIRRPGFTMHPNEVMRVEEGRNIGAVVPDNLLAILLRGENVSPVIVDKLATLFGGLQAVRAQAIAENRARAGRAGGDAMLRCRLHD